MQLHHHRHDLDQLGAQVLLISFGPHFIAQNWHATLKTDVDFPLLLDPQREIYDAYGLKESFWGSFGLRATWYYLRNLKLPNIQGNPTQLGGDFIVDPEGVLRYAHRSQDAADRPPLSELLPTLQAAVGVP